MGASLLDQVLAETLDPAYQQAADARAARVRAAAEAGTELPSGSRGRRVAHLLVALVLAVAGLLAAITYDQASAGAKGRSQVREALLNDIDRESTNTDTLTRQLDQLRTRVDRTRDSALRATTVGQVALSQLATAEQAGAAVAVTGPGLAVTLADAKPNADGDPVGGRGTTNAAGTVRDSDVQLVVNALWAAGAEAISIDGQRLGPTSTIRTAGQAILVDLKPVSSPYLVSAVGDKDALSKKFLADREVETLALVSQSYGLRFVFAKEDHLSLPASTPSELHFAQPVPVTSSPAAGPTPGG
ncbi:MAG: hypothetical protein JWO98_3789 [Frankiales bacterium]|nr:hypothetical protein [Frankiales bacterium]